ncbi:MAG: T9SS type A sorting domain-containing protein [Bacteroidia bacterium]
MIGAPYIYPILITCLITSFSHAQSWSYTVRDAAIFSSPKTADLNNDRYPDIVIATGNEDAISTEGILALDGRNGQKIWSFQTRNQVYGSAVFQDVNNDGTSDVFIGGRKGQFYCLDGKNGTLIWSLDTRLFGHNFDSLKLNLYTPAWVPDQDGDGIRDLVNVYGGGTDRRVTGWLVLLSGKTGQILARDTMPDGMESYCSPLAHDFDGDGEVEILFGSGEERRGGKLYRCSLAQLKQANLAQAEILAADSLKGFIAVSSLADFNGDGILDIACPALNKTLLVIDGSDGSTIFKYERPGYEHYVTPVIGNFTSDGTPDILCSFQKGLWPFYQGYSFVLIDGADGSVAWERDFARFQLTQHVALDLNQDSFDELIFCHNSDTGFFTVEYSHQLQYIDFQEDSIHNLRPVLGGLNIFSTPLISDFDQDKRVEITYGHTLNPNTYYTVDSARIVHLELDFENVPSIAWGGYLGNKGDGIFRRRYLVPAGLSPPDEEAISIFPNPNNGQFYIQSRTASPQWKIFNMQGKEVGEGMGTFGEIRLPAGSYLVKGLDGKIPFSKVMIVR